MVQGSGGAQTSQLWATDKSCPFAYSLGSFTETITLTNIADQPRSLFTQDGTPRTSGGTLVVGYSAISLQLIYDYQNVLPLFLGRSIQFTAIASARPRNNTGVTCTYPSGSGNAPCPGVY